MKTKGVALAIVLLVLGGVVSPSYGAQPPMIQLTPSPAFKDFVASNGELGLYLVGKWDLFAEFGGFPCFSNFSTDCSNPLGPVDFVTNTIFLVNPTPRMLWAFVTFWGGNEEPLACVNAQLSPNATAGIYFDNSNDDRLTEIISNSSPTLSVVVPADLRLASYGALKILSTTVLGQPAIGLVGYIRQVHRLAVVPFRIDSVVTVGAVTESRLQPVPPEVLMQEITTIVTGKTSELRKIRDLCKPSVEPPPG